MKRLTSPIEREILPRWWNKRHRQVLTALINMRPGEAVTVTVHILFGNQPSGLASYLPHPNFLPVLLLFWIVISLKMKGGEGSNISCSESPHSNSYRAL